MVTQEQNVDTTPMKSPLSQIEWKREKEKSIFTTTELVDVNLTAKQIERSAVPQRLTVRMFKGQAEAKSRPMNLIR